jgi:hypothetical protein
MGMNPISPEQWAYFAGFLDGEGCIQSYLGSKRQSRRPKITIAQKDPAVLRRLQSTFGGGLWYSDTRDHYLWYSDNLKLTRWILEGVAPYLVLKKRQAQVALELCSNPRPSNERQQVLHQLLKKLKRLKVEDVDRRVRGLN